METNININKNISVTQNTDIVSKDVQTLINEIMKNPESLKKFVEETNQKLEQNKKEVESIKNKNLISRLFTSSTKDIATALLDQNDTMMKFFQLLQIMTFVSKGNSAMLFGLMESLNRGEQMSSKENGNLFRMAKSFLQQAIDDSKAEELREMALKKLLKNAILLNEFQKETEAILSKFILDCEKQIEQCLNNTQKALEENFKQLDISISKEYELIKKELNTQLNSLVSKTASIQEETQNELNKIDEFMKLTKSDLDNKLEVDFLEISKTISCLQSDIVTLKRTTFLDTTLYKVIVGTITFIAFILSLISLFI